MSQVLGFDIGGSSVKSALVDIEQGTLQSEQVNLTLDSNTSPDDLIRTLADHAADLDWSGPVGVGYPGVIVDGKIRTAAHLDRRFVGSDFLGELSKAFKDVALLNDADAAGLAEMSFGAGRERNHSQGGTVLMLTLGTGIGSALFTAGRLFPNTEFGHMYLGNQEAEEIAAASIKTRLNLSYTEWSERLNRFLNEMYRLLTPDLIVLGGAVSEDFSSFQSYLKVPCEIKPAVLGNRAGLVGAALAAGLYAKK